MWPLADVWRIAHHQSRAWRHRYSWRVSDLVPGSAPEYIPFPHFRCWRRATHGPVRLDVATLDLERSLRYGELVPLLATFGLAIVLENVLFEVFSADTRSMAPQIGDLAFDGWELIGGIYIGKLAVLIFLTAVIILGSLHLMLKRTNIGRAIRATAQDIDTAELVHQYSRKIYAIAVAISVATSAIAGMFLAMRATFDPYAGPTQLIFAFEAVVIGGTGSLWGTLIGGIILGVAQSLGAQFSPQGFLLSPVTSSFCWCSSGGCSSALIFCAPIVIS